MLVLTLSGNMRVAFEHLEIESSESHRIVKLSMKIFTSLSRYWEHQSVPLHINYQTSLALVIERILCYVYCSIRPPAKSKTKS